MYSLHFIQGVLKYTLKNHTGRVIDLQLATITKLIYCQFLNKIYKLIEAIVTNLWINL